MQCLRMAKSRWLGFTLHAGSTSICVVLALNSCSTASANDNTTFRPVSAFVESLQPSRPVSGDAVAGFAGAGKGVTAPPQIDVWIPSLWSTETLCTMVRSRDGRYEAYQAFQVPASWKAGYHTFSFREAREIDYLEKATDQLAVLAFLGTCGAKATSISLAYLGGVDTEITDQPLILLNTKRADEASLYFFESGSELTCQSIEASDRQVYDFKCAINQQGAPIVGEQKIEINKVTRGNYDDADVYYLYFPEDTP